MGIPTRLSDTATWPAGWQAFATLSLTGLLVLAAGLLLYWIERDVSRALLIPRFDALHMPGRPGAMAGWLPSLLHTMGFGLLTAAALPRRSAWRLGACAAWCVVNIGFEIGQHPALSAPLADALLARAGEGPVTQALAAYFRQGRFDTRDIAATLGGALVAAALLAYLDRRRGVRHKA
ncbi:MAG: hypothetical protein Q8K96_04165 [Rubrivivax sp.]|nr:hypothetical protein [Rubrivivax sp.]